MMGKQQSQPKVVSRMEPQKVSFLHIGKTGGTAIKDAWAPLREGKKKPILINSEAGISYEIKFCGHGVTTNSLDANELFMFCIRHPIKRFISGFNSRLTEGRPRYNCPWMESEKIAFSKFKTPNELAEGLSSEDKIDRIFAQKAMKGIRHIKNPISSWTGNIKELMKINHRIFFIFNQETLNTDHDLFLRKLSISKEMKSKVILGKTHAGSGKASTWLSRMAEKNLQRYYKEDIFLYKKLLQYKKNNLCL